MSSGTSHYNRRKFIQQSALGLFSLPFVNEKLVSDFIGTKEFRSMSGLRSSHTWGMVLNTLKDDMQKDYRGTLEQLARMGYKYVEGKSYRASPKEYREFVHSLGLKIVAGEEFY